ncbi:Transcriptional regulator, LysR family [Candidatus Paraburkholderia kirkii]|nr:Transcriptional regulator, LysR family [Candidatus Paraburkholderia kirkii]
MVVARNHEPLGSLRIVAPVVFGLHNLAPVLQTYAQRYPKVVPDVTLVDRQVDINVAYPSRRHLPAKVRTFIDHLVEHFSQTPNHQVGEQWIRDGRGKPVAPAAQAHYEHADEDAARPSRSRPIDGELAPKVSKTARSRGRVPATSPF